jgi:hypothetical protein
VSREVDERDIEIILERPQRFPQKRVQCGALPVAPPLFSQFLVQITPGFPV